MKTRFATLLLVFLALSAFRTDDPAAALRRKWKLAPESVPVAYEATLASVRAQAPDQAAQMEENRVMVEAMLSTITLEFKADGTFEVNMPQGTQNGTWKVSEDGTKLVRTRGNGQTSEDKFELADGKLTIHSTENKISLTYVPAE